MVSSSCGLVALLHALEYLRIVLGLSFIMLSPSLSFGMSCMCSLMPNRLLEFALDLWWLWPSCVLVFLVLGFTG